MKLQQKRLTIFSTILICGMLGSGFGQSAHAFGHKRAPSPPPTPPPAPVAALKLPVHYQIGVHYNPPFGPIQVTNDPAYPTGYNEDEGWSKVPDYWWVNNPNGTRPNPNDSVGFMDWMWISLRTIYGFDQSHVGHSFLSGGVRENRLYPEREPLLDGKPEWFEYFDPVAMNKQVDSMRDSGIDFIAINTNWINLEENCLSPADKKNYGCIMTPSNIDYFVDANRNRDPSRQVLLALQYNGFADANINDPNSDFAKWAANLNGVYVPHDGPANRQDFINAFSVRTQYYIDHYFNVKDAKGNALYLFHSGRPVLFMYDTGTLMAQAKPFGVSVSELIDLSNAQARAAGYPGIWWVDTLNTLYPNATGFNTVKDYGDYQDLIADTGFNASTTYNYQGVCGLLNGHQVSNGVYSKNNAQDSSWNWNDCLFWGYQEEMTVYSALWKEMLIRAKNRPGFKYFLPVSPGWDSRPVGENAANSPHDISRSCDGGNNPYCSKDGALFKTMLQNAKAAIDANQDTTDQMLMVGTWNEFGEGTFVMPTVSDNGAHAKAIKDVFKPDATSLNTSGVAAPAMITVTPQYIAAPHVIPYAPNTTVINGQDYGIF